MLMLSDCVRLDSHNLPLKISSPSFKSINIESTPLVTELLKFIISIHLRGKKKKKKEEEEKKNSRFAYQFI